MTETKKKKTVQSTEKQKDTQKKKSTKHQIKGGGEAYEGNKEKKKHLQKKQLPVDGPTRNNATHNIGAKPANEGAVLCLELGVGAGLYRQHAGVVRRVLEGRVAGTDLGAERVDDGTSGHLQEGGRRDEKIRYPTNDDDDGMCPNVRQRQVIGLLSRARY